MRGVLPCGDTIRRLRRLRGWSQEQLSVEASCASRTVRKAEQGARIDGSVLRRIADALGVSSATISIPDPVADVGSSPSKNSTANRNQQLVLRWQDALVAGDIRQVIKQYHPEALFEMSGQKHFTHQGSVEGIAQVQRHFERAARAFRVQQVDEIRIHALDNLVFHRSRPIVVDRQTKDACSTIIYNEFEIRQDRIIRHLVVADFSGLRAGR